MAKFWAIAVGIHQYQFLNPLPFAEQDAKSFSHWLMTANQVEQVYCLSDTSPELILDGGAILASQPTFENLRNFLQLRFSTPFLEATDTLCFFFSGHGLQFAHQDYLLCQDSDPLQPDQTGIAVDDLVSCLRRGGTDKIVLMLDACHTNDQKFGQGFGTDPKDVITLFATNFNQLSHSIPEMQKGVFTYALIESWRSLSQVEQPTLEDLYHKLCDRLPALTHYLHLSEQTPRLRVDPPLAIEAITLPQLQEEIQLPAPLVAQQLMQETTMKLSYW